MKKLTLLALLVAGSAHAVPAGTLAGSKHDLSATGPGAYRAVSETNPCAFCHVPHGSGPGLNGRPDDIGTSRPYESSTSTQRAPAVTGASRICLSCHDGTVALGRTRARDIDMVGGNRPMERGSRANLGTDLRGSHPISIVAPAGARTSPPPRSSQVKLDHSGQIQCTSCHDPHAEWGDPVRGKFLVMASSGSQLCLTCHPFQGKGGPSAHASSSAAVRGEDGRMATVAEVGCLGCHDAHGARPGGQLVKNGRTSDAPCLSCHDGSVARSNIAADVQKPSAHLSADNETHDEAEGRDRRDAHRLPEASPGARRHVTCVDCHEPHAERRTAAVAPAAGGLISGTWGVGLDGRRVDPVRFEYEVCLKCHGDSANKPQSMLGASGGMVRRASTDANLRRVFDPSAPSFHPVAAPGRNPDVPSLVPPYTTASLIFCTDCHASDGAATGGARGPHGSVYEPLLERQYLTADLTVDSPASYALCYKCHDHDRLVAPGSPFPAHAAHLGPGGNVPCSACHAAHGVSRDAGNDAENAHLISLDRAIARPAKDGRLRYVTTGPRTGTCYLECHGRAHDDTTGHYPSLPSIR